MALTELDIKILKYIYLHGLLESDITIAKNLKISPTTLNYSITKMEKENIIQGYRYRFDLSTVGLCKVAWVFVALQYNNLDLEKVIDYFANIPCVRVVHFVTGLYDLSLKIYGKDIYEITKCTLKFEEELHDKIKSVSTYFIVKNYKQFNLPIPKVMREIRLKKAALDVLDERVENPELSLVEIADRLKMHRNTVGKIMKWLIKKHIILKKSALINPNYHQQIGIGFKAIIVFEPMIGKSEELANKLSELDIIHELNLIAPANNLLAVLRVADIQDYYHFINTFFKNPKYYKLISKTTTRVIVKTKETPVPLLKIIA